MALKVNADGVLQRKCIQDSDCVRDDEGWLLLHRVRRRE